MSTNKFGVIGGSGFYEIDGLENIKKVKVETPFGDPSDMLITGDLNDVQMVFLSRHGGGHIFSPSKINYRANIYALKKLGVTHVISISAVGSLKEEIKPGDFVLVDQFIDKTKGIRKSTFFDEGIAVHVEFSNPVCESFGTIIVKSAENIKKEIHKRGTYLCIEGPQFSTKAESNLYRSWGVDIIGMTNIPESKLAREVEICYSSLALVTDYDCWKEGEKGVSVNEVVSTLKNNVEAVKSFIKNVPKFLEGQKPCLCKKFLEHAIMTNKKFIPDETKKKLELIIGKYL